MASETANPAVPHRRRQRPALRPRLPFRRDHQVCHHLRTPRYGDWTGTSLRGWNEQLLTHYIQPM